MTTASLDSPALRDEFIVHVDGFHDPRMLEGIVTRHGGASSAPFASLNLSVKTGDDPAKVEQNRRAFERLMHIETRQVAFGRLTHGDTVVTFNMGGLVPNLLPPDLGWPMFDGDAAVSNVPGLMLVMTFADCVPVLLFDQEQGVCGLAHAGWRGTALRVASKTVRAMVVDFGSDPTNMHGAIGPCIGACCYPVGESVQSAIRKAYGEDSETLLHAENLDLVQANTLDLISAGLPASNVHASGICTSCQHERFFSHRAENGRTGRFGACIGLPYPGRFADSDAADELL